MLQVKCEAGTDGWQRDIILLWVKTIKGLVCECTEEKEWSRVTLDLLVELLTSLCDVTKGIIDTAPPTRTAEI